MKILLLIYMLQINSPKLVVTEAKIFRDGGSIIFETNRGNFYRDHAIDSKTRGVYFYYESDETYTRKLDDKKLIKELEKYRKKHFTQRGWK